MACPKFIAPSVEAISSDSVSSYSKAADRVADEELEQWHHVSETGDESSTKHVHSDSKALKDTRLAKAPLVVKSKVSYVDKGQAAARGPNTVSASILRNRYAFPPLNKKSKRSERTVPGFASRTRATPPQSAPKHPNRKKSTVDHGPPASARRFPTSTQAISHGKKHIRRIKALEEMVRLRDMELMAYRGMHLQNTTMLEACQKELCRLKRVNLGLIRTLEESIDSPSNEEYEDEDRISSEDEEGSADGE